MIHGGVGQLHIKTVVSDDTCGVGQLHIKRQ